MSGHAYFGEGVNKIKHISFYHGGEMKKIKRVWQYHNGVYRQVWTGASTVSYYDGDTLIGVEEIDEGDSALHPHNIDTSKEGYTLYGWKANPNDKSRLEHLIADGEPITLYAYYVPDVLVIATGVFNGWSYDTGGWHSNYVRGTWNSKYITGASDYSLQTTWSQSRGGNGFTLALNEYQNASVAIQETFCRPRDTGYLNVGVGYFDNDDMGSSWNYSGSTHSKTYDNVGSGSHSLTMYVISYEAYAQAGAIGITSITLSNPKAWT